MAFFGETDSASQETGKIKEGQKALTAIPSQSLP
jgi:hypothetical protein